MFLGMFRGYIAHLRRIGHEHCRCSRSNVALVRLHNPSLGSFPVHFQVTDFEVDTLCRMYGLVEISVSYGSIDRYHIGALFTSA